MPTTEELELIRTIRREFAKRPIDSTRLEVQVIRGRVYLSGVVATIREEGGVDLKVEVAGLIERLSKIPIVKQVICDAKLNEEKKREAPQAQGRVPGRSHGHGPSRH